MQEAGSQRVECPAQPGLLSGSGASPIAKKSRPWIMRLGLAGFLFFLIKGLLWLIVPTALVWLGVR